MKIRILFLFIFLSVLPLTIFRDFTPDNELKYLSIADEAIEEGHIFAFYNHGEPYADKPPLYLWAVIAGKLLFGEHLMWFLSLFSIIPALLILSVMNKWVEHELREKERKTAVLLLFTSAFYLACSVVLRMDMLMTLFITLSLYTFYKMYRYNAGDRSYIADNRAYKRQRLLFPVYIFLAIFSKGAVGILVPVVSVIVFLFVSGKIRTLGAYLGFLTWGILAALCGLWFTGVYLDGGTDYLNNLLFNQTINRAVDSFHHKEPVWYYGITYWYAIAPWSLLTFGVILLGFVKHKIKSDTEKLLATVTLSTLVMMSLVSSKIVIYLLPCFPFMLYLTALLLPKVKENFLVKLGIVLPAAALLLPFAAALLLLMLPDRSIQSVGILNEAGLFLRELPLCIPLPVLTALPAAGAILALVRVKRDPGLSVQWLAAGVLALVFAASFSIPSLNNKIGLNGGCRMAYDIAENAGKSAAGSSTPAKPTLSFYDFRAGMNLDAYFKQYMEESGAYSGREIKEFTMRRLQQSELDTVANVIMFVKTRDFSRDSILNRAMGHFPRYSFGEFSVVIAKR